MELQKQQKFDQNKNMGRGVFWLKIPIGDFLEYYIKKNNHNLTMAYLKDVQ